MDTTRLFVTLLVFGVLVTSLLVSDSGITGFVPTDTISQNVNLTASSSQRYSLKSDNNVLTSLSISGEVVGSGLVNVYLSNGNEELLVYSNKRKISSAMQHITGLSALEIEPQGRLDRIDSLPGEYIATSGVFETQCAQTCVISGISGPLYLDVVIDPGTTLTISKIVFSQ
jgi:hypothetical protein